jgi:hypothetical protein
VTGRELMLQYIRDVIQEILLPVGAVALFVWACRGFV